MVRVRRDPRGDGEGLVSPVNSTHKYHAPTNMEHSTAGDARVSAP